MNNTERDAAIKRLEARMAQLLRTAKETTDWGYKNELTSRAGGIEEALQQFDPKRQKG